MKMKQAMKIILREDVAALGKLGDVTTVRAGYARNFLFPQGKAERANAQAIRNFEHRRAELETVQQQQAANMEKARQRLDGYLLQLVARASPDGNLYGSISAQHIAASLNDQKLVEDLVIKRGQVVLPEGALKALGEYPVKIHLRADCDAAVTISVLAATDETSNEAAEYSRKDSKRLKDIPLR